jgi:hypothetical protein
VPLIGHFPIVALLVILAGIMLLPCEIGYPFGKKGRTRSEIEAPAFLGSMVGGPLGMLAFVLAFTFSIASSHHDLRKARVLEKSNAIGTAYLRADLLTPLYGDALKRELRG